MAEGFGEVLAGVEVDSAEVRSTDLDGSEEDVVYTGDGGGALSCSGEGVTCTGGDEVDV